MSRYPLTIDGIQYAPYLEPSRFISIQFCSMRNEWHAVLRLLFQRKRRHIFDKDALFASFHFLLLRLINHLGNLMDQDDVDLLLKRKKLLEELGKLTGENIILIKKTKTLDDEEKSNGAAENGCSRRKRKRDDEVQAPASPSSGGFRSSPGELFILIVCFKALRKLDIH